MAGVIRSRGRNIDTLLEPRTSAKIPNVGIRRNGRDISNDFERASSGVPAGNLGIKSNGTDIGQLFAARGGVTYWDGSLAALPSSWIDAGDQPGRPALADIQFLANGQIRARRNYPFTDQLMGMWTGGYANSSNTQIRFTRQSGDMPDYNGAPNFTALDSARSFHIAVTPPLESGTKRIEVLVELRETNDPASTISRTIDLNVFWGDVVE